MLKFTFGLFLIMSSAYVGAQNQAHSIDANTDSLYQDSIDTTTIKSCLRFTTVKSNTIEEKSVNPNSYKLPKEDPYKKKFTDMQIINAIRNHISR